jgi:hypothetical protein
MIEVVYDCEPTNYILISDFQLKRVIGILEGKVKEYYHEPKSQPRWKYKSIEKTIVGELKKAKVFFIFSKDKIDITLDDDEKHQVII